MQTPKAAAEEDAEEGKLEKDQDKSVSRKNNGSAPAGTQSANPVGDPNDVGQAGDYSR